MTAAERHGEPAAPRRRTPRRGRCACRRAAARPAGPWRRWRGRTRRRRAAATASGSSASSCRAAPSAAATSSAARRPAAVTANRAIIGSPRAGRRGSAQRAGRRRRAAAPAARRRAARRRPRNPAAASAARVGPTLSSAASATTTRLAPTPAQAATTVGPATADEHGVRARQPGQRLRCGTRDHPHLDAVRRGVLGDPGARRRLAARRPVTAAPSRAHSTATDPDPGAHVPHQRRPGRGASRASATRPHLGLGDHARPVGERVVGQRPAQAGGVGPPPANRCGRARRGLAQRQHDRERRATSRPTASAAGSVVSALVRGRRGLRRRRACAAIPRARRRSRRARRRGR